MQGISLCAYMFSQNAIPKNGSDEDKVHRFLDLATHCQNVLVLDSQCLLFHVIIQPFIFCSTS